MLTESSSKPSSQNALGQYDETIQQKQHALIQDFELLADWTERYRYLIELGRALPPLEPALKSGATQLFGCQAKVWLTAITKDERVFFKATSDSDLVLGLVALLVKVYSGQRAKDIVASSPDFIQHLGLAQQLTQGRATGLAQMIQRIYALAHAAL